MVVIISILKAFSICLALFNSFLITKAVFKLHCVITIFMQSELILKRNQLPALGSKQPMLNVFEMIKLRRAEFTRELQQIEGRDISLPVIACDKLEEEKTKDEISGYRETNQEQSHYLADYKASGPGTPANKYKVILDQLESIERSGRSSKDQIDANAKIQQKSEKRQTYSMHGKNNIRIKTETKGREQRKFVASNATSIQKSKAVQSKVVQYDDSMKRFCSSIEQIPKNMKMRNEENLTETIAQLQMFNPFFNRNTRIVNVCLLKMGKIVVRSPPAQLFKVGEQLDYFYIIMFGKIKIVEGGFRRVCETGETVLEEVLFSDKSKKCSLERAKVIAPSYLLQMRIEEFKKLKEELIKHGLKLNYQEMESIIKRNFIIKNWMRNKRRLQKYK